MTLLDVARLVVYRFHEKGLEVFLIQSDLQNDSDVWRLPRIEQIKKDQLKSDNLIEIDAEGEKIYAMEGDWHNIPSIRGLIKHDVKVVKSIVKETIPSIDKGAFVAFKETVKKLIPNQYLAIKELKEILVESNSIRNL